MPEKLRSALGLSQLFYSVNLMLGVGTCCALVTVACVATTYLWISYVLVALMTRYDARVHEVMTTAFGVGLIIFPLYGHLRGAHE